MTNQENNILLRIMIAIMALADGILHFSLDFILFRGNFLGGGPSGPPPGAAPGRVLPPRGAGGSPFILPLNELFLLNFIGAVILVVVFWFAPRWLGRRRWVVDVVLIAYEAAAFTAWLIIGRPNPMGLGYLSKGIEIVLVLAIFADLWSLFRPRQMVEHVS